MSEFFKGGRKKPDPSKQARRARFRQLRKERKHSEAETRNSEYRALTPQERLQRLDRRLGVGMGAKKERARLMALISPGNV